MIYCKPLRFLATSSMKNYLFLPLLLVVFLSACRSSGSDNNNLEQNTSTPNANTVAGIDTLQINAEDLNVFSQQLPILDQQLQGNALRNMVAIYANKVLRGKVSSQKDLEDLLDSRSKVITLLHDKVLNPFFSRADTEDFYNSEKGASFEKELNRIGIQTISAEGMYIGLAPVAMLDKEFKQLADEPFRLFNDFVSERGNSLGGEYPYSNLEHQIQLVWLGEQMTSKYPDNLYTAKIRSDFRFALNTLTDFHQVSTPAQGAFYIVSGLLTEPYPTMTDYEQLNNFVKQYPQSKYSRLTKSILRNTSDIKLSQDSYPQPIYLVVARWIDATITDNNADCESAEKLRNSYLDTGFDIPHLLRISRRTGIQCAVCYRFYSSSEKATQALATLKKMLPDAEGIFRATYNANTNTWTAE